MYDDQLSKSVFYKVPQTFSKNKMQDTANTEKKNLLFQEEMRYVNCC